jgi:hypothetical protein
MNIILRTVCGCERIVTINARAYPQRWIVPYRREPNLHIYLGGDDFDPSQVWFSKRTFERIYLNGLYGYPVYLEVLSEAD